MKKLLKPLAVICLLCVVIVSCKKKNDNSNNTTSTPATTRDMLIGNWKVVQYADDDNNNGILDDSEKYGLDSGETDNIIYKADGTGLITGISPSDTLNFIFTWVLQNNDKEILTKVPLLDSSVSGIKSITATDLTIMDDINATDKSWTILKK